MEHEIFPLSSVQLALRNYTLSIAYWLKTWFGIDRAIAWVSLNNILTIATGPITLFLISQRLTPEEQGYYYAFSSLLGLRMFFELGLGGWIMRFVSYDRPKVMLAADGAVRGTTASVNRLFSLLRFTVIWFSGLALLFLVLVSFAGLIFFGTEHGSSEVSWRIPWLLIVIVSAFSFTVSPLLSFLEGFGLVAEIAFFQFIQNTVVRIISWGGLLLGLGLLFFPISGLIGVCLGIAYLVGWRKLFMSLSNDQQKGTPTFNWKHELMPLQWRTAMTFAAGYFAWQTMTPIIFKFSGPTEAGKLGMSLALGTMLQSFGMAWINTKVPSLGALFGQGNLREIERLFKVYTMQVVGVMLVGSIVLLTALVTLNFIDNPFSTRLLSPQAMAILLISFLLGTVQIVIVVFVRLHKQEPFVIQMIALAVALPSTCYIGVYFGGIIGMLICTTLANAVFGLFWTWMIYCSIQNKTYHGNQGA